MAVQREHLTRAPAREAVIDIHFEPKVTLEAIDIFISSAQPDFKRRLDLWEAIVGIRVGAHTDEGERPRQSAIGRRLDSDEPPHVLQCRVGGFTFSRLSPYGRWRDLRSEAIRWWDAFDASVRPQTVTRIAVRYINEIKLPLPIKDFSDYLTCSPQVPEAVPQGVSAFLQRVVIPDESNDCISIVTQAMEDQTSIGGQGGSITVLLDIDVFRVTSIDRDARAEVWTGLDTLREQKNRMFFEHVTDKAVEMFV